jgi:hypothetical protein
MKRQGTGRVLTFAVTGALLGGVGIGGCSKHRGPTVNTEPVEQPAVNPGPTDVTEPEPEPEPDHVNEGPVDEPEPPTTNVTKQPDPK